MMRRNCRCRLGKQVEQLQTCRDQALADRDGDLLHQAISELRGGFGDLAEPRDGCDNELGIFHGDRRGRHLSEREQGRPPGHFARPDGQDPHRTSTGHPHLDREPTAPNEIQIVVGGSLAKHDLAGGDPDELCGCGQLSDGLGRECAAEKRNLFENELQLSGVHSPSAKSESRCQAGIEWPTCVVGGAGSYRRWPIAATKTLHPDPGDGGHREPDDSCIRRQRYR